MSNTSASRAKFRSFLLGGAAALAIGGAAVQTALPPSFAVAQATATTQAYAPISLADTVERVRDAVVSVKVKSTDIVDNEMPGMQRETPDMPGIQPGDPLERFFRRFGENGMPGQNGQNSQRQRPRMTQSQGSGFIISADGYVVTNNHVIDKASEVMLTLNDGRSVAATIVGTDQKTDLALLKIKDGGTYPFVKWAAANPRVGDTVVAIGNPFGLGGTVTSGIVSARGRDIGSGPYDDYLQIDASVNHGNSGGPTFNVNGEVVGVNTAIYSPSGGSVGIGFAIPVDTAKNVVAALKDNGSVARGYIGVQIQPVTAELAESLGLKSLKGALIAEVQPNTPAGAAGLRSGDVITAVNGDRIDSPRELSRRIAGFGPDKSVAIAYIRDSAEKSATVKLGALPAETRTANVAPRAEPDALTGLGLTLAPAQGGRDGVMIAEVDPRGAAAETGLRKGDMILEAAGKSVSRPADVRAALDTARKDGRKTVLLRVRSSEGVRFVTLPTAALAG